MSWASIGQVRQEVSRGVEQLKKELLVELEQCQQEISGRKDLRSDIEDLQRTISNLSSKLERQDRNLAMIIEGAVRRAIVGRFGPEWTLSRKVGSLREIIEYIRGIRGEQPNWAARAESDMIDMCMRENMIYRIMRLFQLKIGRSTSETWEGARSCIREYPLVDKNGEPIVGNISFTIGVAPMYYKQGFIELRQMLLGFNRDSFAISSISFMCVMMLSDPGFEEAGEVPPHMLEFDCGGKIVESVPGTIHISGAEIKSSASGFPSGENQLFRRFRLLQAILTITDPGWANYKFIGEGHVFAPWFGPANPVISNEVVKVDEQFQVSVVREELQEIHEN